MSTAPKRQPTPSYVDQPLETYGSKILSHMHEVVLFSDIRDQKGAIEALVSIMGDRTYKAGQNIIIEGTSGAEMFILYQGRASVYKSTPQGDEYKVAIFDGEKNIAFGESGLIDADARSATIRADTECHCVVLERRAFERYSATYPQWALPIYRRIAQSVMARMKKTNNDMMLLYNALVAEIRGE